jgi:cobalt-zinc-cadmium efflux system membrane fusion protein
MFARDNSDSSSRVNWRAIGSSLASWAISIVTTAALVAVGWVGHATHWTFGFGGHAAGHVEGHGSHASAPVGAAGERGANSPVSKGSGTIRFDSKEAVARTGIELVEVEERPMVSEVVANGVVRYDERNIAQLSTRVPGIAWRVEKHLGDRVKKGEVLLVVESGDVGRLKAEFLNSLVAYESKREQLSILEEVKGAVMGRQVREAKAALREARNHLTNAEQALVNLGFSISVAEYEKLDDETRAARIRILGLDEGLIGGIESARVTSNLIPLRAPFDGVVIGRDAVAGEVVESGHAIIELADVSTMWVVLNVSKEDAAKVAIGQPLRFRPDGSPVEYMSRISWISTEVNEETRTLEVRAEIDNRLNAGSAAGRQTVTAANAAAGDGGPNQLQGDDNTLRANTFGSGRIEIDRRGTAIVVPRESVQWDGTRWVVFVPAGETAFESRPVQPGLQDGNAIEILGDFAGDAMPTHVVGTGSHVLKSQVLLDRMEKGEL